MLGVLSLVFAATWGCAPSGAAEMQLLRVSPERISLGSETVLTVTGRNIRAAIRIDLDSTKAPELGQFVAWVGEVGPLASVTPVNAEELQIVVPGSVGLGRHALVVRATLSGATARIPDAVEVFDEGGELADGGVDVERLPAVVDASSIPDAALLDTLDAGVEDSGPNALGPASLDAGASADATPGPCAGASHGGVCWYLGAAGATCEETCEAHGGFAPETAAYVGTAAQGGSSAQCATILGLLGEDGAVITASRSDVGIGCHQWGVEGQAYWLTAPDFSPTAGSSVARVVCGCKE